MYSRKRSSPHSTASSSNSYMAYFFSVSDEHMHANPIGFEFPSFCFCHSVAPNPFVLASVVKMFSRFVLSCNVLKKVSVLSNFWACWNLYLLFCTYPFVFFFFFSAIFLVYLFVLTGFRYTLTNIVSPQERFQFIFIFLVYLCSLLLPICLVRLVFHFDLICVRSIVLLWKIHIFSGSIYSLLLLVFSSFL